MKDIILKLESLKNEVDSLLEYVKEQESKPKFSKVEKRHLEEDLKYMSLASNHTYTKIRYFESFFVGKHCVQFFYISKRTGEERFDEIGGSPCYTQKMEPMKTYEIKELLK